MRVATIFGTRPEIIRLSAIARHLDLHAEHVMIHTGQNYDDALSDIFFGELNVRAPNYHLGIRETRFSDQLAQLIVRADEILEEVRPDRLLVLGDTNSGLAAIAAARRHIPVFHLEAGNRCYDDRVPEEINRRIIDHCSTVLMPYTHRSKENLLREGIDRTRIYVVGNPITEVLANYDAQIRASDILQRLELQPQRFFLATLHRAENVDRPERLRRLLEALANVANEYTEPVIVSLHPHTADKMRRFGLEANEGVRLLTPLGFSDFVALERAARCVISDSGTVQEECCIQAVPSVTIRDTTERPETIECGSGILTGDDPAAIVAATRLVLASGTNWRPPAEYLETNVSRTVAKIVLGYHAYTPQGVSLLAN